MHECLCIIYPIIVEFSEIVPVLLHLLVVNLSKFLQSLLQAILVFLLQFAVHLVDLDLLSGLHLGQLLLQKTHLELEIFFQTGALVLQIGLLQLLVVQHALQLGQLASQALQLGQRVLKRVHYVRLALMVISK